MASRLKFNRTRTELPLSLSPSHPHNFQRSPFSAPTTTPLSHHADHRPRPDGLCRPGLSLCGTLQLRWLGTQGETHTSVMLLPAPCLCFMCASCCFVCACASSMQRPAPSCVALQEDCLVCVCAACAFVTARAKLCLLACPPGQPLLLLQQRCSCVSVGSVACACCVAAALCKSCMHAPLSQFVVLRARRLPLGGT